MTDSKAGMNINGVQVLAQSIILPRITSCAVCQNKLDTFSGAIVTCTKCRALNNLSYTYEAPKKLSLEQATFHFNVFNDAVRCGVIRISTPRKKCTLLDIGGTLRELTGDNVKVIPGYVSVEAEAINAGAVSGKFDFIFLGKSLHKVGNILAYLTQLKSNLRDNGVIQITFNYFNSNKTTARCLFDMPTLYDMLLTCGYTVRGRLCVETPTDQVICCQ